MARLIIIDQYGTKWEIEVDNEKIQSVQAIGSQLSVEIKDQDHRVKCDIIRFW